MNSIVSSQIGFLHPVLTECLKWGLSTRCFLERLSRENISEEISGNLVTLQYL